nr:molybdopterin-guanine dinucleotide biosynthesis protein B [Escherichia coli]
MKTQIPLLGIAAYSGTGKTTLLKKLIPQLNARGIRIALIKHTHHDMDVDTPGKDSYELRKAGAEQTLVASD